MKSKKIVAVILLFAIFMLQLNFIQFNFVYAEDTVVDQNSEKFHYKQLTDEGKSLYNAMYYMYVQGILKTGTQDYDLTTGDKYVTQEQLESYNNGNTTLKEAMNAARYAFYADYPEIFYVNFQKLSLRVTKGQDNRYHAYIGSGRFENYYIDGFTNVDEVNKAIEDFDARVNEIVEKVNNINVEENSNIIVEKVKLVHNEIIYNTGYRLESDCTPGNEGYLGTPYGALVKQQSVCEGYARALKTVLDRLNITSILVQGTHQSEGSAAVPHMWNYVQVEKETYVRATEKVWYAVDATLDDPFLRNSHIDTSTPDYNPGDDIVEGFENTRYCIVGTETMNKEHIAIETVEAAGNYIFKYPELNSDDYGVDTVTNSNGLLVKYKQDGTQTQEYKAGDYYVSYNGKGYEQSAAEGNYMIMKSYYYKPGDDEWEISKWAYFLPDVYAGGFKDYGDYIFVSIPNSEYVEFAVTTLAPGDYVNNPLYLAYQGDESDFVARTKKLYNPSGTYKGKPYIKKQTPVPTTTLEVGPTYHVDVTYTDDLILEEGATQPGYKLVSSGPTGADETEITNFKFDGKNRVTFDLKFSKMWADDEAMYYIYLTGLVGKNSGKAPLEITYGASNYIACSFSMNKAKNWEVFARPILLENEDLSMNEWRTSDGEAVSDKLKSRIALVTTRTTEAQKTEMNNLMEEELENQKMITSETYNISLNVCKKYVVKTGHRLRLSLGFPAGYGPEDAGVTFKAYHFTKNADGEQIVEEIPCVVTQYGLIVTCDSFSPFAIAVVENDGTQVPQEKAVIVSDSEGGRITGANREEGNIITLAENESKTINIEADEGYEIERITVFGENLDITDKDTMNINVNYSDVKDGNCIVDVGFVAKSVAQKEEQRQETVVQETAIPANITNMPRNVIVAQNTKLTINPTVENVEGILTYQWYKDGQKLNGKVNKTLTIESPVQADQGNYTLKVTTTAGTSSVEATSDSCTVTIKDIETSIVSANQAIDLEKLNPGNEFEVCINLDNFTDIQSGVISLTGQLEYDTNILEMVSINAENGWTLDTNSLNGANFRLTIDSSNIVENANEISRVKFRVKENINEDKPINVKVKELKANVGEDIILLSDAQIGLKIEIPNSITSTKYIIEGEYISRIVPETTVSQFKQNVTHNENIVFIKDGNELGENSIIGTGTIVKVGSTKEYTLVVTGDINGDGRISIGELAQLKLHCINSKELTGAKYKAGDINGDGNISINDIAKLKLVLINLLEIK